MLAPIRIELALRQAVWRSYFMHVLASCSGWD